MTRWRTVEIAQHLGITQKWAREVVRRPDFPRPVCARVRPRTWDADAVQRWARGERR